MSVCGGGMRCANLGAPDRLRPPLAATEEGNRVKSKYIRRDTAMRAGGNRGRLLAGVILTLFLAGVSGCTPSERHPIEGGLDFQGYCEYSSFEAFDEAGKDVTCRANTDLLAACKDEYDEAVAIKKKDPDNPKSGLCYNRIGKSLGGIKNMTSHCGTAHSGRSRVRAELVGQTWQCRMPVDASAVCAGQRNDSTLKADRVGDLWECYRLE
jgi:hypothetical protein